MLEQALAKVMNLGLNCRQVTGPVCFPSRSATFIPLSAFHTWIFPSSDPENPNVEETGITICKLFSSPFSICWGALVKTYQSWQTENLVWKKPLEWHLYCCYSPAERKRHTPLNTKTQTWTKLIQKGTIFSPQTSGAQLLWKHPALWAFLHWWRPEWAFHHCWTWDQSTRMFAHIVV